MKKILRNKIKTVWKKIMRNAIKLYSWNRKLIVINDGNLSQNTHYSQFGQDSFVLNEIFKGKHGGTFVDIGANHPTESNNTYLLELNGWNGIAIEPQQKLRDLWTNARKTPCIGIVAGPENKEILFIEGTPEEHGLSGVQGFNKCHNDGKLVTVDQRRLDDILNEHGLKKIDYLSIDVEGYEMNVLKGLDFSKVDISVIGLENDLGFKNIPFFGARLGKELGNNEIRSFLKKNNYTYFARVMCDDFFIKK